MISLTEYVRSSFIREGLLTEARWVDFEGDSTPLSGWCVILAGGSASGKSSAVNNHILPGAKVMDVDSFKIKYLALQKEREGISRHSEEFHKYADYKLGETEEVSKLHNIVKSKGWKEKDRRNIVNSVRSAKSGILPNIVFDITGKDISDFEEIIGLVRPLGYKIKIVWVVLDYAVAARRNYARTRKVNPDLVKKIHSAVYKTMTENILGNPELDVDSVDILFTPLAEMGTQENDIEMADAYFPCIKTFGGFRMTEECRRHLDKRTVRIKNLVDLSIPKNVGYDRETGYVNEAFSGVEYSLGCKYEDIKSYVILPRHGKHLSWTLDHGFFVIGTPFPAGVNDIELLERAAAFLQSREIWSCMIEPDDVKFWFSLLDQDKRDKYGNDYKVWAEKEKDLIYITPRKFWMNATSCFIHKDSLVISREEYDERSRNGDHNRLV